MWFFTSPRNPFRETIETKRKRRADALKHAPAYSAGVHQKYLDVTGIDFAPYSLEFILVVLWGRLID
jgi:hypothetical protein